MTTAQVVEKSVTVNNNSPQIQDYVHPDDQTQTTFFLAWVQTFHIDERLVSASK